MKKKWEEVKNRLDELEQTEGIDWTKIPRRELKIIQGNLHTKERERWSAPVAYELIDR